MGEWLWKGKPREFAAVNWIVSKLPWGEMNIRHLMSFAADTQGFDLDDESIENEKPKPNQSQPYFFYRYQNGQPVVNTLADGSRGLARDSIEPDSSILAQRRDPEASPELAWLALNYEKIEPAAEVAGFTFPRWSSRLLFVPALPQHTRSRKT